MDNNENNDEKKSNIMDITGLIKFLFKKKPIETLSVLTTFFYIICFVFLLFMVLFLIYSAPAMLSEGFSDSIHNFSSGISDWTTSWGEKVGNLFSGYGFYGDNDAARVQEEKYYRKLQQVAKKYKDKYDVEIDTTMITATLFAGRIDELENESDFDGDIYSDSASFYKQARNHIETLAKFQLMLGVSVNYCSSSSSYYSYPTDSKELAESWVSIGNNSWSSRLTVNKVEEVDNIISCDYVDAQASLRGDDGTSDRDIDYNTYSYDRKQFLDAKKAYINFLNEKMPDVIKEEREYYQSKTCYPTAYDESMDINGYECGGTEYKDLNEDELKSVVTGIVNEYFGIKEEDKFNDYQKAYRTTVQTMQKKWLTGDNSYFSDLDNIANMKFDEGIKLTNYTVSANVKDQSVSIIPYEDLDKEKYSSSRSEFKCISTGDYGPLDEYKNSKHYRNYMLGAMGIDTNLSFDNNSSFVGLINRIQSYTQGNCLGDECENTMCSKKPSVELGYSIDTFEEEGIYYWKLLSNLKKSGQNIDIEGSFIKNYYFRDENPTTEDEKKYLEEAMIRKVDEIFGLYKAIAEERINLSSFMISSGISTIKISPDELGDFPTLLGSEGSFENWTYQGVSADASIGTSAPGVSFVLGTDNGNLYWKAPSNYYDYGQCTWYAHGRGIKALVDAGNTLEEAVAKMAVLTGNGGQKLERNAASCSKGGVCFSTGSIPKSGSLAVMNNPGNKYGHVAYIEKVFYDENGTPIDMLISEGGNSLSGFYYHRDSINYFSSRWASVGYIYLLNT